MNQNQAGPLAKLGRFLLRWKFPTLMVLVGLGALTYFLWPESHTHIKEEGEAKAIIEQLQKGGDFAAIAKEKSTDTGSREEGGQLGWSEPDRRRHCQRCPSIGRTHSSHPTASVSRSTRCLATCMCTTGDATSCGR